jgi:hypothetical protein
MRTLNSYVPVIVGLWSTDGDLDRARQRLSAAGATNTVVSFAECVDLLEGIVAPKESQSTAALSQLDPARP